MLGLEIHGFICRILMRVDLKISWKRVRCRHSVIGGFPSVLIRQETTEVLNELRLIQWNVLFRNRPTLS